MSPQPSTPNVIEWHHDSPSPPLSPLSRDGYCPPWPDPARQATVSVPRATLCRSYISAGLKLHQLLEPFGITKFYPDGWGAYERHLDTAQHHVGKENTQTIESKHINLRTRIKRFMHRTLCFSKTERMHDLVIGLFIKRYEFGRAI